MPPSCQTHSTGNRNRKLGFRGSIVSLAVVAFALTGLAAASTASAHHRAGTSTNGGSAYAPIPKLAPGQMARLSSDHRTAIAPLDAPLQVQKAIWAANRITRKPYIYGGGHRSFRSRGYDCSGTVSYALHGAGLLKSPLDSTSFMHWGDSGPGQWITVYTNRGHAYVYIAGLRFDTSGRGQEGPRWRTDHRSNRHYRARHPEGF